MSWKFKFVPKRKIIKIEKKRKKEVKETKRKGLRLRVKLVSETKV